MTDVPNFASLLRCCCLAYLSHDFDHMRLKRVWRALAAEASPAAA